LLAYLFLKMKPESIPSKIEKTIPFEMLSYLSYLSEKIYSEIEKTIPFEMLSGYLSEKTHDRIERIYRAVIKTDKRLEATTTLSTHVKVVMENFRRISIGLFQILKNDLSKTAFKDRPERCRRFINEMEILRTGINTGFSLDPERTLFTKPTKITKDWSWKAVGKLGERSRARVRMFNLADEKLNNARDWAESAKNIAESAKNQPTPAEVAKWQKDAVERQHKADAMLDEALDLREKAEAMLKYDDYIEKMRWLEKEDDEK